jgi:hypothetical protein
MSTDEQEQMLSALRQALYSYLLSLHILLLCAAGHTPTEIAAVLFCSRSSVYRTVAANRRGKFAPCWEGAGPHGRGCARVQVGQLATFAHRFA